MHIQSNQHLLFLEPVNIQFTTEHRYYLRVSTYSTEVILGEIKISIGHVQHHPRHMARYTSSRHHVLQPDTADYTDTDQSCHSGSAAAAGSGDRTQLPRGFLHALIYCPPFVLYSLTKQHCMLADFKREASIFFINNHICHEKSCKSCKDEMS